MCCDDVSSVFLEFHRDLKGIPGGFLVFPGVSEGYKDFQWDSRWFHEVLIVFPGNFSVVDSSSVSRGVSRLF